MSSFARQACQGYQDWRYNRIVTPASLPLHDFDPSTWKPSWLPADFDESRWTYLDRRGWKQRTRFCLYRFYDADRDLLYLGTTSTPPCSRWAQHRGSEWWALARYVRLEPAGNDYSARFALERTAIRAEHPRFNKVHTTRLTQVSLRLDRNAASVFSDLEYHLPPETFAGLVQIFQSLGDGTG